MSTVPAAAVRPGAVIETDNGVTFTVTKVRNADPAPGFLVLEGDGYDWHTRGAYPVTVVSWP